MPSFGGIIALDLSEITGWAYGLPGDARPLCGTWVLASGGLGRQLVSFENELDDAITLHAPRLMMVEAPLPPTATSNAHVWRQQLGLAAMAEATAYRRNVMFREMAASTIRKEILGTARFARGQVKPAVVAYCKAQGWHIPDHNAGDACVTWQYSCRHLPARWIAGK